MKTTTTNALLQATCLSLLFFTSNAQTEFDASQLNRAIMREFNGEELQDLIENDLDRLNKLVYYFSHSFSVENTDCQGCIVDYNDLFNLSLFNVQDFESQRLEGEESTFLFKEKYSITLFPRTTVISLIGGITPFELIHGIPERPFPLWISTNNDQSDFDAYKSELILWSADFPEMFLEKKNAANVLKVRFMQFVEMTNDQKNAVLTFPGGYLIVDEEIMSLPH